MTNELDRGPGVETLPHYHARTTGTHLSKHLPTLTEMFHGSVHTIEIDRWCIAVVGAININ